MDAVKLERVTEWEVTKVPSTGLVFVYALNPYCTYEDAALSVDQLITAELDKMDDVNTPETTGGLTTTEDVYSLAPISEAIPCGRAIPSMSVGTVAKVIPLSMAGEPGCR